MLLEASAWAPRPCRMQWGRQASEDAERQAGRQGGPTHPALAGQPPPSLYSGIKSMVQTLPRALPLPHTLTG